MERSRLLEQLRALRPWLIAEGVARIAVFGSHAHDNARADSDIDLLVEFADRA